MSGKIVKVVLPNGVEFVRHIGECALLSQQQKKDTKSTLPPLVSRAKSLTENKGYFLANFDRE